MKARTRTGGYAIGQWRRRVIEEAFGWIKDVAGLRKLKHVGRWKIEQGVLIPATVFNLVRMSKLLPG